MQRTSQSSQQDDAKDATVQPVAPPRDDRPDDDISPSLAPISSERFGYAQARHLLWRAGFGGTDAQIRLLASWGPEKSVDHLLNFGDKATIPAFEPLEPDRFRDDIMRPPSEDERRAYRMAQQAQNEDELARFRELRQQREQEDRRQIGEVQKWWLERMIETRTPLEEKLTLFWHGHFATSYRTIENSQHMLLQNQLFRQHAVGNFGELLAGIIRDPAMLAYLDNNDSRKGQPNENLAREVMELFSLGVGNYSEDDIKEGARALTGYTFEFNTFQFRKNNHDNGKKSILGQSGTWDGDDFVKIILSKRACAQFITRRLYNFLVADVPPDERGGQIAASVEPATRSVLRELGDMLYARKYNLRPVLRRLLLSRHFYDDTLMAQQIKSPAMLVVGAVRSLQTPVRDLQLLNQAMDMMGQRLFFPPSVKGWDGGRTWINTSTLFVRQNVLAFLLTGQLPRGVDGTANAEKYDAMALLSAATDPGVQAKEPGPVADHLLKLALGTAPAAGSDALRSYFAREGNQINSKTVTGALLLITAMPEYQLC
jgi:uncharacterized protein (DUF1800 family)